MATGYASITGDLTTYTLHPSHNDITSAGTEGDGKVASERVLTELLAQLHNDTGWIVSGFDYSSGASLNATFNGGEAIIDGHRIISTGTFTVACEDAATNHIWLTWQETADLATNIAIYNATSDSPPSTPYVKIATVTTSGGAITGNTDERRTRPAFVIDPATTKGDIYVFNGSAVVRLAAGTNTNVLTADSAQAAGVKWAAVAGSNIATVKITSATTTAVLDSLGAATVAQIIVDATSVTAGGISVEVDASEEFTVAAGAVVTRIVEPSSDVDIVTSNDSDNIISCGQTSDKIWQHSGKTSTITTSFSSPSIKPWGVGQDSSGNLVSCDDNTNKIYIHSGISATITTSFSSPGTSPFGIDVDSSDDLVTVDDPKVYIHSGKTSTISSSFTHPESNPRGIDVDSSDNLITGGTTNDKIYVHSGQTATLTTSFSSPTTNPQGIGLDSSDNIISCDYGGKIYIHSGKTATITDSFNAPDSTPTGVTLADVTFAGTLYASANHA